MSKKISPVFGLFCCIAVLFSTDVFAQNCNSRGYPEGISCLHCMDPRVKASTPQIVEALKNSCAKNLALAFVVDGSLGFDENVIRNSVSSLLSGGKSVTLHLYLLNGSAIRKASSKLFSGFLNNIPPDSLRNGIKGNKQLQDQIKNYSARFVPLLRWASARGVRLSICPMLEDNLDNQAFDRLLGIVRSVVPKALPVSWTRNPCPDCYIGNQSGIPAGVLREDHRSNTPLAPSSKIVSNDGWGFVSFAQDPILNPSSILFQGRTQRSIRLKELDSLRDAASQNGAMFLLWLSKYQYTQMGVSQIAWSSRPLPTPLASELKEITKFFDD